MKTEKQDGKAGEREMKQSVGFVRIQRSKGQVAAASVAHPKLPKMTLVRKTTCIKPGETH